MQKEDSLMYTFLMAQKKEPKKGDWYSDVNIYMNEFKIDMSEEAIKQMQEVRFKALVKKQAIQVATSYLKEKQINGEKGSDIIYKTLELQDYLSSSSNLTLEDQQLMFSLRCKMNHLKVSFSRNEYIKEKFCIESCQQKIDNEHLTWCAKLNSENEFKYSHILNGNLEEKIKTLKQIKSNEKRRNDEKSSLVIQ